MLRIHFNYTNYKCHLMICLEVEGKSSAIQKMLSADSLISQMLCQQKSALNHLNAICLLALYGHLGSLNP